MNSEKKAIIFLVDGKTDKMSLEDIITNLCIDYDVFFKAANTDITSAIENNNSNILNIINELVDTCLAENGLNEKDVDQIVHIIDTDGTFVDDSFIKYRKTREVKYTEKGIFTRNVDDLKKRNERKASLINRLIGVDEIDDIPYNIYYFSSNIEHVMHDIQNADNDDKTKFANRLDDKYEDSPKKFIEYINNNEFAVKGTYEETWDFIKLGNNSLKRYTNFNLFIDNLLFSDIVK